MSSQEIYISSEGKMLTLLEIVREGIEIYAVVQIRDDDKCEILSTHLSKEVAMNRLQRLAWSI